MSFKMTTLGEYAKVQGGFAYKSKDFIEVSEYRVLKIKNVRFGTIDYSEPAFVPKSIAESTSNWRLNEGDILISMTGSGPNAPQSLVGRVARVWKNEPDAWFNQRVGRINLVDNKKIHPDFLFFWLSLPHNQDFLVANSSGSANQANISGKTIESLPTPIVDYEISSAIAKIARELDEKIILNNQTNQTLEQIAQAIFKSWFVDFDPVKAKIETLAAGGSADDAELAAMSVISAKTISELNGLKVTNPEAFNKLAQTAALFPAAMQDSELGEIPKGWDVGELSELIDFNPKRTLKKGTVAPYLDMKNMPTVGHLALDIYDREMGSGTKFVNGDTLLARITPCLENGKTAFVDFLEDKEVGWGSTEYIVMRSKSDSYKYFSYFMARFEPFRKFAIQSMTGTSGRQRAQAKTVQVMPFVIPPFSVLEKFDELITANMRLLKRHGDENKTLAELRDTLVPKLLSGEIGLTREAV